MKGILFPRVLEKNELRVGIIYFVIHVSILPVILGLCTGLLIMYGFSVSVIGTNAVYLLIGFAAVFIILRKFLMDNFERFLSWLPVNLLLIVGGFIVYYVASLLIALALTTIAGGVISNPNNESVTAMTLQSLYPTIAIAVLLAPLVEECLFRGVIFCGIGAKSKLLGYLVSTLLFAFSHVYQSMISSFSPELFLTMLIYVPAGLVLGWAYEKSGTIWCSVFLHMAVNLSSILLTYYTNN